jgi:hypothetical protein
MDDRPRPLLRTRDAADSSVQIPPDGGRLRADRAAQRLINSLLRSRWVGSRLFQHQCSPQPNVAAIRQWRLGAVGRGRSEEMAKSHQNPERSFGVSVGLVLCAIGLILWWRGRFTRAEIVGVIGMFLLIAGLTHPPLLKYPSAAWWRMAKALGYVNARILLTLLFAIVLVPLSLIWKVIGKDPLTRNRRTWPGWSPYPARYRDRQHYQRMY